MSRIRHTGVATSKQKFSTGTCPSRLKTGLAGALGIVSLALPWSVQAQKPQGKGKPGTATTRPKAAIETGRILFQKNCSLCHGASGQGGEGPNLQKMTLTNATISTTIKKGIKGEMPAFGSKFKDADIKALAAFVHSIKASE
jgi:mono/diheme cytochrome c family protein